MPNVDEEQRVKSKVLSLETFAEVGDVRDSEALSRRLNNILSDCSVPDNFDDDTEVMPSNLIVN